jgi:hypothetical protein
MDPEVFSRKRTGVESYSRIMIAVLIGQNDSINGPVHTSLRVNTSLLLGPPGVSRRARAIEMHPTDPLRIRTNSHTTYRHQSHVILSIY